MLVTTTLLLTACSSSELSEEELVRQQTYETNVSNSPEWTAEQKAFIEESRGIVIDEETNEEDEIVPILNSFSPGEDSVDTLASLTKEELLELDDISKMEIFINGVIRDEYIVAAHTLYGADKVQAFKNEFKDALLEEYDHYDFREEDEKIKNIDVLGYYGRINDGNVVRNHADAVIAHLNRVYIKLIPKGNYGSNVSLEGQVYPIELNKQLDSLRSDAIEFTGIDAERNRHRLGEGEIERLNEYYIEMFNGALSASTLSIENENYGDIGGFSESEEGTWEPAQMSIFSRNIISLVYGVEL